MKKNLINNINKSFERIEVIIQKGHFNAATKIINKLYNKSLEINYTKGINLYYEYFILILYYTHENYLALTFVEYLERISIKSNTTIRLGRLYTIKGVILSRLSDYQSSFYFLNKALKINLSNKEVNFDRLISTYISLAYNALNLNDYKKAINYINQGIAHLPKNAIFNSENYSFIYLVIFKIETLLKNGEINKAKFYFDKYFKDGKSFHKKEKTYINELKVEFLILENKNKNKTKIVKILQSTLKISIELNDKELNIRLLKKIKDFYLKNKDFKLAFKYANLVIKFIDNEKQKQVSVLNSLPLKKPLKKIHSNINEFDIYTKSELELAAKYQRNFYKNRIKSETIKVETIFNPSKSLSGDYIGNFSLCNEDNYYLFVLADVVGKGITASYISFMLDGIIKSIIYNTDSFNLKNIIKDINSVLSDTLKNQGFVSLWAGILDLNKRQLESVNAGHLPTYLITNKGEVKELSEGCTILGMFKSLPDFKSEKISFNKGEKIIAYSDGVTEAMDSAGVLYENKFKKLIAKFAKHKDLEFISTLEKELDTHQDFSQIQDDISCLMLEFKN